MRRVSSVGIFGVGVLVIWLMFALVTPNDVPEVAETAATTDPSISPLEEAPTQTMMTGLQATVPSDDMASDQGMPADARAILDTTTPSCFACHRIGDEGNISGPGNNLNGLKDRINQRAPELDAREYVRQALYDPSAFVVAECPRSSCLDIMPAYDGAFTDEELDTLVTFLLSLEEE